MGIDHRNRQVWNAGGVVVNLQGRTFMPTINCPFVLGREEAERLKRETPVVFVDFHAESNGRKRSL